MDEWAALARQPDEAIDLARGALLIARDEHPDLDLPAYLARLDRLAATARRRLPHAAEPARALAALNELLFVEEGFHGNEAEYYDARNSYLNEVLDRRTGIPITLSLVYLEVGWRLGLPLQGIGLPGHFIVGYRVSDHDLLLLDPFNEGALLSRTDCAALLQRVYGDSVPFRPEHLRPATRRQILARILGNLKGQYLRIGDYARALRVVGRLRTLLPDALPELRDQASLRYHLGDLRGARADLTRLIELSFDPELTAAARRDLEVVERLLIRRN